MFKIDCDWIDPDEINNLTDVHEYEGVLNELKEKIKLFQFEISDSGCVKWEHE